MTDQKQQSPGERAILFVARTLLWPMAVMWPNSSWASLHKRVLKLSGVSANQRNTKTNTGLSGPKRRLIVILTLAGVLWLVDLLRRRSVAHGEVHEVGSITHSTD